MTPPSAPTERALQIWCADLDAIAHVLENAEAALHFLAPSELAWTERPRSPTPRIHRRRARIALRMLLVAAGASELPGAELLTDPAGKPRLAAGDLHFSLSHTTGLALFAIGNIGPLGIDLEMDRKVQLGPERCGLMIAAAQAIAPGLGSDFLDAWTCLEAFAKARGSGIGTLLTELGITASRARTLRPGDTVASARTVLSASGLAVAGLKLPDGLYGAIAGPRECLTSPPEPRTLDAGLCRQIMQGISAAAQ